MPRTKKPAAVRAGNKGSFVDQRDELLTLFAEPDEEDERKWRESFGYEKARRAKPFIARGSPRSSSDS